MTAAILTALLSLPASAQHRFGTDYPVVYPAAKEGGHYLPTSIFRPLLPPAPGHPPVDAALGTIGCLEWSGSGHAQLAVWHHALNNDLAIIPTGGEDSISNLHRNKLVGSVRTFVQSGELGIHAWLDALRAGRSYFSTGPLLQFTINGKGPGEQLKLPATGGSLRIEAKVDSIAPLSKAVIHRNGKKWKQLVLSADKRSATLSESATVTGSTWYSLYAEGPPFRLLDAEFPLAATNAVRVYAGAGKIHNAEFGPLFPALDRQAGGHGEGMGMVAHSGGDQPCVGTVPGSA